MIVPARGSLRVERQLSHERHSRQRSGSREQLSTGEASFSHG
jgi:hypothetical protein